MRGGRGGVNRGEAAGGDTVKTAEFREEVLVKRGGSR